MSDVDQKDLAILMAITLTMATSQEMLKAAQSDAEKKQAGKDLVDSFETMLNAMGYIIVPG